MSLKLAPVGRNQLIRRLRRLGFEGPRSGTRHEFMQKGRRKVRIPNPHRRADIGVDLLDAILKQAGVAREEWHNTS